MRRPVVTVVAASGRARAAVVTAVCVVITALLFVAFSLVRVPTGVALHCVHGGGCQPADGSRLARLPQEHLLSILVEPGTRAGVIFGFALLCVPLLMLLVQAVELGSAARARRYAALAVAGATRRDLRRWAVVEVVAPAAGGLVGGAVLWLLLRWALGWPRFDEENGGVVPTHTGPGWWAVAVAVAVLGMAVWSGARSVGQAWSATRRTRGAPRAWGAVLVLIALAEMLLPVVSSPAWSLVAALAASSCLALGLVMLAPWAAHRTAQRLSRRARRVPTLLAARRVTADPWSIARSAAAIGGTAFALAAAISMAVSAPDNPSTVITTRLVVVVTGLAMVSVVVAVALRSVELVAERRRESASQAATGTPVGAITASLTAEVAMASLPLGVFGALLGAVGGNSSTPMLSLVALVVTMITMVVALRIAVWCVVPQLRRAVDPENLRTE